MLKDKIKITPRIMNKRKSSFSNQELIRSFSKMDQTEILEYFNLQQFGLTNDEYEENLDKYGKNELEQNRFRWFVEGIRAYFSPFNLILLAISAYNFASYFTFVFGTEDDRSVFNLVGALVVLLMVIVSGTLTFIQSFRGYFVTKNLKTIIKNRTNVIRHESDEGLELYNTITAQNYLKLMKLGEEMDITQLVPGDLVYLSSGDIIPADVRVIHSHDLFINQSSLTGESLPIEKHADNSEKIDNIFELENICYTGTSVISGSALAVVLTTGDETYFSSIGELMQEKRPEGAFVKGIRQVTKVLLLFMLVMVPLIYFIYIGVNSGNLHNPIKDNPWFTGVFFAVALAVALTPEMLPMIVTTNLANGAAKMTKQKVVVKRFDAIQSLGAIDVLATDKTGTLTKDKIELINYQTIDKKNNKDLIKYLYINSYFQTGLKNPMDQAIVQYVANQKWNFIDENVTKIDEIPFDFNRRKLTIVFEEKDQGRVMVTKGSVEEILEISTKAFYKGKVVNLTEDIKRQIVAQFQTINEKGERVLGVAYKNITEIKNRYDDEDEKELIFFGFANFLDTPKSSAAHMVKLLKKYGVSLKILTGDNEQVTRAICKMVNLKITGLITGQQVEAAEDEELQRMVEEANIFVKLSPLQKVKVLDALKNNNHNVGYIGDGINDAPVLYQADVAISVNNAADIAKEASDIILLEKDLGVLENGIIQGRTVYGNILKYIKITIASQFGNAFSMIIATVSFGNLFLAMSPIQTLFQNLIYDFSQLTIAVDYVDDTFLAKPQRWSAKDLVPFAIINGVVSSIFDITNYLIVGFGYHAFQEQNAEMFQATCFLIGLATQATIVHVLRTEKVPFIQSRSPWLIYAVTGGILVLTYTIVFTPGIADLLQMKSPSWTFLPISIAILIGYWISAQLVKMGYKKVFKKWL